MFRPSEKIRENGQLLCKIIWEPVRAHRRGEGGGHVLPSRRAITTAIYLLFTHDYENDSGCGGVICSTVSSVYRVFAQRNRHHGGDVI